MEKDEIILLYILIECKLPESKKSYRVVFTSAYVLMRPILKTTAVLLSDQCAFVFHFGFGHLSLDCYPFRYFTISNV